MPEICFFAEDTTFKPDKKTALRQWIKNTVEAEGFQLAELNYIFCSDAYLIDINRQYLNHDTYTDIITFDNSDVEKEITGDVFISIDRIRENAKKFRVSLADELHRVMIHGALHLLGYKDKSAESKKLMTQMEDKYLAERNF